MTRRDSPEGRAADVNRTVALTTVYVSVTLWLAVMVGNAALYTVRPAGHWPALETIEALEAASFIPVALILYRISRHSRASLVVAVVGVCALSVNVLLDVAFASGLLAWGRGLFAIVMYDIAGVAVLGWLFSGNILARRAHGVPAHVAAFGLAAALSGTLLYPVWALGLSRSLTSSRHQPSTAPGH